MSANNANLNKVKNMSSDESKPANNSEAPEKGGAKFNSANIKERDQSKLFVKVEGDEERARAAAKKEAAEKKDAAKKAAKEAAEEAAEARHEAKEQKLIAAAKEDARKAANKKPIRQLIKGRTILIVVCAIILVAVIAHFAANAISDKQYIRYSIESRNYNDSLIDETVSDGSELTQKKKEYQDMINGKKTKEQKIAYCVGYISLFASKNIEIDEVFLDKCEEYASTKKQSEDYLYSYLMYCNYYEVNRCGEVAKKVEEIDKKKGYESYEEQ